MDYIVKRLRSVVRGVNGWDFKGPKGTVFGQQALEWAVARATFYNPEALVESLVPGESYRLLLLGGTALHAIRRRGRRLLGNGSLTVRELASHLLLGLISSPSTRPARSGRSVGHFWTSIRRQESITILSVELVGGPSGSQRRYFYGC